MQATIEPRIVGVNVEIFHHRNTPPDQSPLNKHLAEVPFVVKR
jgi:hypothetical protein